MTDFGTKLCGLRKKKGLTQLQVAEKIHVSSKTISHWERGYSFPDITIIKQLAEVLDSSVQYLYDENEKQDNQNLCNCEQILEYHNNKDFNKKLNISMINCILSIIFRSLLYVLDFFIILSFIGLIIVIINWISISKTMNNNLSLKKTNYYKFNKGLIVFTFAFICNGIITGFEEVIFKTVFLDIHENVVVFISSIISSILIGYFIIQSIDNLTISDKNYNIQYKDYNFMLIMAIIASIILFIFAGLNWIGFGLVGSAFFHIIGVFDLTLIFFVILSLKLIYINLNNNLLKSFITIVIILIILKGLFATGFLININNKIIFIIINCIMIGLRLLLLICFIFLLVKNKNSKHYNLLFTYIVIISYNLYNIIRAIIPLFTYKQVIFNNFYFIFYNYRLPEIIGFITLLFIIIMNLKLNKMQKQYNNKHIED